jgi:hypothetical protein
MVCTAPSRVSLQPSSFPRPPWRDLRGLELRPLAVLLVIITVLDLINIRLGV